MPAHNAFRHVSVHRVAIFALVSCAAVMSACGSGGSNTPATPSSTPTPQTTAPLVPTKILSWELVDQLGKTIPPDSGNSRAFTVALNTIFFVQLFVENGANPNTLLRTNMVGFWPGVYLPTTITETDFPAGRIMAARHGFQTPRAPNPGDNYSIQITLAEGATIVGQETLTLTLQP